MKRLIHYLSIVFFVFPVLVVVTPILLLGWFCEIVGDAAEEYLKWVEKLVDRLF